MFSVQDYFNDASQLIPEEKIVKIDKNAEYQLTHLQCRIGYGLIIVQKKRGTAKT